MASLDELSANSDAAREEAQKDEVIFDPGYEPIKKVSILARILGVFGIESDMGGAASSVWEDVIKPTFLDGCRDSMYALADYFFGGGGGSSSRNRSSSNGKKHTNYSNRFRGSGKANPGKVPNSVVYDIVYDDRTEALAKLEQMWDVINNNEFCSVEDYIFIAKGQVSSNYMLGKWGWYGKDLDGVRPVRTGDGHFTLNLPKPKPKNEED